MPKPVLRRDAEKQSAEILIQKLQEKIGSQKESAEAHIQAIREELDEERAAKEQLALDKNELSEWLDKAQEDLNEVRNKNRRLLEELLSNNTIRTDLEDAKRRSREIGEERENLRVERTNLIAKMEHMQSEVRLLSKIRRLLDSETGN